MVSFYLLVCMAVGSIFPGGRQWIFPKVCLGGSKVAKFVFYHSKLRKQQFLLKFSNSCPRHSACWQEKVRATPSKNWCNFERFNTSLNSQILLNLNQICKIKDLTDLIPMWFCFCIGNTKQLYLFLHWQHSWHP